ncbi:MAG: N-acetylmuramoyl-L-alanine amidase, partial [Clostridia bacterium]|nr:N-acetylmuramoyl-L-alanine amidase [Clostridia bacterium]
DIALQPGDNLFTFQNKGVTTTYTVHYDIVILKEVAPAKGLTMDGGSAITVSAVAHKNATVFATVNGQKIPLAITEVQEDENTAEDSDYVTFAAQYTLPAGKEGKEQKLGAVTVTGTYLGQTETLTGGTITVKALPVKEETKVEDVVIPDLDPIDPAVGGDTLAEGTILIVKPDYVETFSGDTTDDYSRPTNAYLPKGTTDILAGTAYDASSNRHYYLLGCGRRVYQEDVEVYITGGRLGANRLIVGGTTVSEKGTAVTVAADWRVPFQLQLLPQKYGNPAKQNYNADAQTTEYIEITFYYTTAVEGTVDISASPLFKKAEWKVGENNTQILRLYLTKKAQFYGYRVLWDNEGNLTFTFKHPTYVGDNDGEQPLSGFTVVVDPGHGGHSYGTSGGGVPEKTIALTYANLLRDKLESLGATVIMTRTDDSDLSLLERTVIARATHADLFLSIHMNGSTSASVGGCSIHYFSDYSIGIADSMFDEMLSVYKDYGSDNRRDWRWSPFYVCRISEMPALLLECGYMTNAEDLELLVTPDFQDALTAAMVKSVVAYAQSLPKL